MNQNGQDEQATISICNFINNPDKQVKLEEIQNIFQIIKQWCKKKEKIKLYLHGSILCFICNQETQTNSQILLCGHSVHQQCYQAYTYKLNPTFDPSNYKSLVCTNQKTCKKFPPDEKFIKQIFGSQNFDIIMDHINKIAIQSIYKSDKEQKNQQNLQKTFQCQVCIEDKLIRSDACTLDCDHRFCFGCISDHIEALINEGKYQSNELICPQDQCKTPIDINIIWGISKEKYDKILELRYQNIQSNDPSIKILRCPGTYKKTTNGDIIPIDRREGYKILAMQSNQLDQQLDMNISSIQQADGKFMSCRVTFEVNIKYIKVIECKTCKCKFCVFCYEDDHPDLTCQQYKEWKDQNNKGDEEFTKYIEKMKMRQCPKCQTWIYKTTGCNHITCGLKTCKHQFCYLCGSDWAPKRKCTCGQFDKVNDVSDK